jgi:hypothetical protein
MIYELMYIGRKGSVAPIGLGVNVSQFDDIENGLQVHNEGLKGVLWRNSDDHEVEFSINDGCLFACPTPDMSKLIVVYSDNEIVEPNNSVILNEDGSRYCQLKAPKRLSSPEGRKLPQGKLTGFMQVGWFDDSDFMKVEFYIADSDFIETRLLRMSDFSFDEEYYKTWRL